MKIIKDILTSAGVILTEEQMTAVEKEVNENYKSIDDWQNQCEDLKTLQAQLDSTKEALKKFDGVDPEALNQKIKDLQDEMTNRETKLQKQIADRDFRSLLEGSIRDAKGRNTKAIMALLDMEQLQGSKNQKEDIAEALKKLSEAEDSKFLFGDTQAAQMGTGDPIGNVGGMQLSQEQKEEADCRAAMGLPAEKKE